ncbi:MAG TPA: hypothetical protein VLE23_14670 [Geminicoccaceae bacterium]|nr:hypothetical protein [Geminicoccaceae bacterium]
MARRALRRGGLVLVGGLLAGTLGGGAAAQEGLCDPAIPVFEGSDLGYRDRGDRCEGIYDKLEVSGSTISVVSFTEGKARYDPGEAPLEITWPSGLDRPVRLRAKPLRPDVFYQMDTVQPATAGSFVWPTDFLHTYDIKDVAILGWAMVPLGDQELPVHLPLAIHQGEPAAAGGDYNLVVVPGVELSELSISIDHLDKGGEVDATALERTELEWGYYPADSGVPIPLPDLSEPGIYQVRLIAKRLRDGIERPEQFWFYRPAG